LHEKTAGNQKGKCPSTLVPILNQIISATDVGWQTPSAAVMSATGILRLLLWR